MYVEQGEQVHWYGNGSLDYDQLHTKYPSWKYLFNVSTDKEDPFWLPYYSSYPSPSLHLVALILGLEGR